MEQVTLISPIDGSIVAQRELASDSQIEQVLTRAHAARRGWVATSIAQRAAIVERMVQYMEANATDIATELTWQMGRPVRYTPNEILRGFQERSRFMASSTSTNPPSPMKPPRLNTANTSPTSISPPTISI